MSMSLAEAAKMREIEERIAKLEAMVAPATRVVYANPDSTVYTDPRTGSTTVVATVVQGKDGKWRQKGKGGFGYATLADAARANRVTVAET